MRRTKNIKTLWKAVALRTFHSVLLTLKIILKKENCRPFFRKGYSPISRISARMSAEKLQ